MIKKPPRSLFLKRYDDEKHWGLFIPVGLKKRLDLYDVDSDAYTGLRDCRMHLCITMKWLRMPSMRFHEIRVRVGMQYL